MRQIVPSCIPGDNQIGIARMSITYTQEADTNSPQDEVQTLTIEAVPCDIESYNTETQPDPCSYYNIKIGGEEGESKHWSVVDPNEIASILTDFIKRYKMISNIEDAK